MSTDIIIFLFFIFDIVLVVRKMNDKIRFDTVGDTLKYIRNHVKLTQTEFALRLGKSRDWYTLKELNKSKIYMKDYINILKIYKFDIILLSRINGVSLSLRTYEASAILRFMRESTGLSQTAFANTINKKRTWQSGNEAGNTQYYANDLFELKNKHNFDVQIISCSGARKKL